MECILAGSLCGICFSLFSGQPLNIISGPNAYPRIDHKRALRVN